MKWATLVGGVVGLGLAAWLLESYGVARIVQLIGHAGGFGILAVVGFHGVQVLCSALGWRAIAGPAPPPAGLGTYVALRWIREAVNNLLPLAQIGGEVIAWRLLWQRGVRLSAAIAGTVADLAMEMATQILFTLLGVILLLRSVGDRGIAATVIGGVVVASLLATGLIVAVRMGLAGFIETALLRLGRVLGWTGAAQVAGLHQALTGCLRASRRTVLSAAWHLISWLLGGVEVWLGLHFLGHDMSMAACVVIESLGQAAKAVGFAVPGALGIQEGGYIVVCRAFGLSPEVAIALSLLKRLREAALGVPGLIVWQYCETKPHDAAGAPPPTDAAAVNTQTGSRNSISGVIP
jgi:putative membrane protein